MLNKGLFTSMTPHWATPQALYDELDAEFHFTDDPCPLNGDGGLSPDREWGECVYMNPPYGRGITQWICRAYEEGLKGKTVVCLIPSRTDTQWWHRYVMKADEIRFIEGRLHFNDSPQGAPFPSAIVVFRASGK